MNIIPKLLDVPVNLLSGLFSSVTFVFEVPDDEEQRLLFLFMTEELEVAFKNDFEKAIVRCLVPTNISSPHVNHDNIGDSQRKQRSRLLKGHPLLASLLGIRTLNIEHENVFIFIATHPDAFCSLLTIVVVVHNIKGRSKEQVKQRRLATTLASDNRHCVVLKFLIRQHALILEILSCGRIVV